MPIPSTNRLDRAFKQTLDKASGSADKEYYEEQYYARHIDHINEIWSSSIPSNPADAVAQGIAEYIQTTLTEDPTVIGQKSWLVCSAYGNPATKYTDFIPPRFGQGYEFRLFQDNGAGGMGDEILTTQSPDGTASHGWYFDYQSGVVTLTCPPTAWQTPLYCKVYRYKGTYGQAGGGGGTGENLTIQLVAGEGLSSYEAITIGEDGKVWKLVAGTTLERTKGIGLVTQTCNAGDEVPVIIKGKVANPAWAWTWIGGTLYSSATAGQLRDTPPLNRYSIRMGIILSPTSIILDPEYQCVIWRKQP